KNKMATNFSLNSSMTTQSPSTTTAAIVKSSQQFTDLDLILMVSYAVVFIIGIFGNTLVCLMFKLSNGKLKVMEYIIVCLAVTDLIASIINPALYTYWQITNQAWHFGFIGCKLSPIVNRSITNVSFGIIMLINIERCIVITRPFRPKMKKKQVNMAMLGIVVIAILLETPYIYHIDLDKGISCRVPNSTVPSFAYPAITIIVMRALLFFITFVTTFICIYKELYDPEAILTIKDKKRMENNKTVLIMLTTIAVVFILLVFPRDILHVIYIISWLDMDGIPFTHLLRNINATFKILHMCNSVCNVFIYAGLHRRFRRDVKRKVSNAMLARTNAFRAASLRIRGQSVLKAPDVGKEALNEKMSFDYDIDSWEWEETSSSTV
uniref:G-protein coupled receptors family 1 profile domain-containing protein n=2 Tax=Clytia hemisphaerica TaxID=252671 RepID=A0A7M5V3W1_9CNID